MRNAVPDTDGINSVGVRPQGYHRVKALSVSLPEKIYNYHKIKQITVENIFHPISEQYYQGDPM
jgi:hypothetical protein